MGKTDLTQDILADVIVLQRGRQRHKPLSSSDIDVILEFQEYLKNKKEGNIVSNYDDYQQPHTQRTVLEKSTTIHKE